MQLLKNFISELSDIGIVTQEQINSSGEKTFSSGRIKKIGDKIYFGFLINDIDEYTIDIKLISFHEEEADTLYLLSERRTSTTHLPFIEKK